METIEYFETSLRSDISFFDDLWKKHFVHTLSRGQREQEQQQQTDKHKQNRHRITVLTFLSYYLLVLVLVLMMMLLVMFMHSLLAIFIGEESQAHGQGSIDHGMTGRNQDMPPISHRD